MNGIKSLIVPVMGLIVVVGLVAGFAFGFIGEDSSGNERTENDRQSAATMVPEDSQGAASPNQPRQSAKPSHAGGKATDIARDGEQTGPTELLAMMDDLKVAKRERGADYDRHHFGEGWVDVDNNTCFTRADILARDLDRVKKKGRCKVQSGTLHDPYTGKTIAYQSGKDTSEAVQIDHVVALLDAWGTGAQGWDEGKRVAFANDPLNLLAVDGPTNDDKGHKNAAQWLPPNRAFHCHYVARQVAVKARYGLWVTADEQAAMAKVLTTCPATMRVQGDTIVGSGE